MINQMLASIYKSKISNLLSEIDVKKVNFLANKIKEKKIKKKNIFIFGNGGSSSTANHFAVDMTKNAKINVTSFSNDNLITCYANDYGYDNWTKNIIKTSAKRNDLVIFVSCSGNSSNVVNASKYCKRKSIYTFSLTGMDKNNKLNKVSNSYFWVDSKAYNQIEIIHHVFLLMIVDILIGKDVYKSNM